MKTRLSCALAFGVSVALGMSGCAGKAPAVTAQSVRVGPFVNPQGKSFQMIFVDWKNTGNTPVRVVRATLTGYGTSGNVVFTVPNYTIYASSSPIAPGGTYSEPSGDGYVVTDTPETVTRVEAVITKVEENLNL